MTEPSGGFAPVLALYDFRSKQEYIYRTNRLQEISGASKLIEDIYDRFLDVLNQGNEQNPPYIGLRDTSGNDIPFGFEAFTKDQSIFGQVLYSGGGSLMMLYRSEDIYFAANRRISRMVLEKTQSLSLIAAHIPFDPRQGFRKQRTALYEALARCKSEILPCLPCNVTPFTQTGFTAHMPIAYRQYNGIDRELSRESFLKLQKYREIQDKSTSQLDQAVRKKGEDSLLAIVYIDGNNMGEKLKACLDGCSDNIDDCVAALRGFSADTAKAFVEEPYAAISQWTDTHAAKWLPRAENRWFFRRVIGGGDEITFICTAGLALKLVQLYFSELRRHRYLPQPRALRGGLRHRGGMLRKRQEKSPRDSEGNRQRRQLFRLVLLPLRSDQRHGNPPRERGKGCDRSSLRGGRLFRARQQRGKAAI